MRTNSAFRKAVDHVLNSLAYTLWNAMVVKGAAENSELLKFLVVLESPVPVPEVGHTIAGKDRM